MWVLLVIFVLSLLYYLVQRQYSYWSKRGVPGPTPMPIVGNIGKNIIGKISAGEIFADIYRKYENYPFVGVYKAGIPCLLVRDPDLIRHIAVKDFKHFTDNEIFLDKDVEPLLGRNPFFLRGEEWRKSRSQLTPCFTSGKMKYVFPMVDDVAKRMVKYIANKKEATTTGLEAKYFCTKFTIANVASSAFGIEERCFEEKETELEVLSREFFPPPSLKIVALMVVPTLANFLSTKFLPQSVEDRIYDLVRSTRRYRKENNVVRNDFLDFVNQLASTNPDFTELDVVAHSATFLGDGVETSAHVMSYFLFELASNLDVQDKLRKEINDSLQENELSYETLQQIPYLDACLNESMRKNPPVFYLSKLCTEKYTYTPSSPSYKDITVTVEPGTPVIFPLLGLHLDPKYYESPDKFIPERFLNKDEIPKYTYLPFGEGPRMCLGQRFALMQVKTGMIHLINNFEIKLNSKTQLPLSYDPWHILPLPKGGLWLNFHKI